MTSTTLLSDIVLPAATWYEKHDLSTTDMHPYVHAFSPAIDPPWEAVRTSTRSTPSPALQRAGQQHLGTRSDIVLTAAAARHPRCDRAARWARDWLQTGERPGAGQDDAKLAVVERDYTAIYDKWVTLGPLVEKLGLTVKGVTVASRPRGRRAGRQAG